MQNTIGSGGSFDPWGKVRSGGVPQTKLNYTGQRLDDTGLLYYHARYYDPSLARFVSPDSIVPGVESGKGGAAESVGAYQNHRLTVDFHESGFASSLHEEHKLTLEKGFWFQLEDEDREEVNEPWGPRNPQALNRYAYTVNNPLRYTDPTGHCPMCVAAPAVPIGVIIALAAAGVSTLALGLWLSVPENRESLAAFLEGSWENLKNNWDEFVEAIKAGRPMEVRNYRGDKRTAQQIISDEKKGTINSEFPEEWKDKTFDEIDKAAKAGNARARTARKLLTNREYDKGSKR